MKSDFPKFGGATLILDIEVSKVNNGNASPNTTMPADYSQD